MSLSTTSAVSIESRERAFFKGSDNIRPMSP